MDENLEALLKAAFEMGLNRGLGRVATPAHVYLQWQDARAALLTGAPSLSTVRLFRP